MPAKILVVEDDRVMARLESSALQRAGHDLTVAHTAAEAIEIASVQAFNLIVLDLFLPDGDGLALCVQLRAFADVPVLMVSCLEAELGEPLTENTLGPHSFLAKPFGMQEFVDRVHSMLGVVGAA
jgi:DNA-binding response OmpR family regulator